MLLYRRMYPSFSEERYNKLAPAFGIAPERSFKRLSKGVQKQAAFWLALSLCPKYMLLDEPLDHVSAHIAVVPGGQVAVVALLEVDAQLGGDLILHLVERALGLRHDGSVAAAGAGRVLSVLLRAHVLLLRAHVLILSVHALILVLIHRKKSPFSFHSPRWADGNQKAWPAICCSACSIRRLPMLTGRRFNFNREDAKGRIKSKVAYHVQIKLISN